jgi:hypothetical protein
VKILQLNWSSIQTELKTVHYQNLHRHIYIYIYIYIIPKGRQYGMRQMRREGFIRNVQLCKGLIGVTPCNGKRGRDEEVCVNRRGHTEMWRDDAGTYGTGESRIVLYMPTELLLGIFPGNCTRKTKRRWRMNWNWISKILIVRFGCVEAVLWCMYVSVQALLNLGFGCYRETDLSVKVQSKSGGRLAPIPGRGIVGFFSGGGLKQQTAWTPIICLLSLTTPTSLGVGLPTAAWHADDHFQGSNDPRTPLPAHKHTHTRNDWQRPNKLGVGGGGGGSCGEHSVWSSDN